MVYDKQLYSRQEFAVGSDAQTKLSNASVILIGLSGLGVEVAKNLVLIGINRLTLVDKGYISREDLSTNFFARESDIGKKRTDIASRGLGELNPTVKLESLSDSDIEDISIDTIRLCSIVIVVNKAFSSTSVVRLNNIVRSNGKGFILAENYGVSGVVFVDFGPAFKVIDPNGETFQACRVASIGDDGRVECQDDQKHGLERGDVVEFCHLKEPLTSMNGSRIFVKDVVSPYAFTIDYRVPETYNGSGQVVGKKQENVFSFECLEKQLLNPTIIPADFMKMQDSDALHAFFRSLHSFISTNGYLPRPFVVSDAEIVIQCMKSNLNQSDFSEADFKRLAMCAQGEFIGITSFLGGLIAHEALKGICGKFTPLRQFYYFDAREMLPPHDCSLENLTENRYIAQQKIFGSLNDAFFKQKYFIVGAGALGCELIKNFAMAGVGCSTGGEITVTDMDTVEKSNLSRQFLFRTSDMGSLKSECAARKAKEMNPDLNITWLQEKVSDETIDTFNDSFWENLDGVCTALDNIQSRQWVDSRCVYYRVPLIDSGTMGSSANSQVVIPSLTESYSSSADPPERAIPVCTLKNFPTKPEHTIQWARDAFEGLFFTKITQAEKFLSDPQEFLQQLEMDSGSREEIFENLESILNDAPQTFKDCVKMARRLFDEYFTFNIRELLESFPPESVTAEGKPFWSAGKRQPVEISYESDNQEHNEFIMSCAALFAHAFSVETPEITLEKVSALAQQYTSSEKTKRLATVSENADNQADEKRNSYELKRDALLGNLQAYTKMQKKLVPISFEKDDDANYHVLFVTSCSNLRAVNYGIDKADFYTTKRISGRIIPAMVTTTASIVGLVMIELAKLAVHRKSEYTVDKFKNAFLNLAIGFTAFSEPIMPKKMTYGTAAEPEKYQWSIWDRFEVDLGRDVTVKELLDHFLTQYNIEIAMLSCGVSIVYSIFSGKSEEILPLAIADAVKRVAPGNVTAHSSYLDFEVLCSIDDVDVDVPSIRYKFRHPAN
ncbi:ubiquitin-like modifier-activating enzyme [Perkinsela sp. CCAP 1560/4]|nr:ubiquitin-like modifier-activating enzyme [Perkinsela sp. CCAP 1560/4]|eukprot:KNH08296.1 ubiquitin-like modifier-activating enzyme [Perkinsela sp. CCAP 1560/4]